MSTRTPSCCLSLFFLIFLNKVQNTEAQCTRPLLGGNLGLADNPMNSYPDGSNVTLKCLSGYVTVNLTASKLIFCNGTLWTTPELQCKGKSCGPPGEFPNGHYEILNGIEFGATITGKCNEGYIMQGGNAVRNCREDGWDGRPPICEAVKCLRPPSITDGQFAPVQDFYSYLETVIYSCKDKSFTLFGNSSLSCSANATFQPDPPRCLVITCDRPYIPNGYRVEGKAPPYGYRNFVRYACSEGYTMNGTDYLVCEENGWNPPPPQCNGVTCKAPQVANAKVVEDKPSYGYKESIKYTCFEGYELSGSDTLTCGESGWSKPPPLCNKIKITGPSVTPPPSGSSTTVIAVSVVVAVLVLGYEAVI